MTDVTKEQREHLGPLASWIGVWVGPKGLDVAPGPDRQAEETPFSERMTFEAIDLVDNHEQLLGALRYQTEVTQLSNGSVFHEEVGYWLWDSERKQVMRSFAVPRGIAVLAGGEAAADARSFLIEATRGDPVFGVSANPFLDEEFRIERFSMDVRMEGEDQLHYEEDTQIRMPGRERLFHHTDTCLLARAR